MDDGARFYAPGSEEYARGTQPENLTAHQRPAFVAFPASADDVSGIILEAASRGLTVVPQATGHGAGGELTGDTVIIDTSALKDLAFDVAGSSASAGAGLTWGEINRQAEAHGLLGLAGSSPGVAICGYTFGGGLGWLTRPYGMAASALRTVQYVDGSGVVRIAAEDAADPVDRDALWAFRGGGGVGVATRLEFDLKAVTDLHAGYLMWPIDALDAVVNAWAASMSDVGDDVSTSIAVLHLPPGAPFPDGLRGAPVVHLALAASNGDSGAIPLLDRVRAAATPVLDTWGPSDATRLGGIHLDPPVAVPAIGDARWLTADAPAVAKDILAVTAPADSPLALIEIRSVGNSAPTRPGAVTSVPGPYVVHAVAAMPDPSARARIDEAFSEVRSAAHPADVGLSVGSWVEGAVSVPDALPAELRQRVAEIADAVDPARVIARSRYLA